MTPKHLCLLLLAGVACVSAQNEDELIIPVENDNKFPPDIHPDSDSIIDGSGFGAIEEPIEATSEATIPLLEDVQQTISEDDENTPKNVAESTCPHPCVCHVEGDPNDYVVDCSNNDLTELPSPIDDKTTILKIQNNKLTEIPKEISALKNLKVLNAEKNSIMDLASGSISELPELIVLNLRNNRLVDYPKDLKNGFGLSKLEELNLGGNDMRTTLNPELFSSFTALRKLILPTSTSELLENLCGSLKETLETVCTETCDNQTFECPDAPQNEEDELINAVLPGTIALNPLLDSSENSETNDDSETVADKVETTPSNVDTPEDSVPVSSTVSNESAMDANDFSLRSAVNKAPDSVSTSNDLKESSKEDSKEETEEHPKSDVAVGATTVETKTGGVDKSVIGFIIAGMVVVVAGITIKKNWSSIKNKFSSSPRPANDRSGVSGNGTTPEEVPLQDKSPV